MSDSVIEQVRKAPWMMLISLVLGAGGLGGHFINFSQIGKSPGLKETVLKETVLKETVHEVPFTDFLYTANQDYKHCVHNLIHQHAETQAAAESACSLQKLNKLLERQVR